MSKKNSKPGRPPEGIKRKGRIQITIDSEVEHFIDGLGPGFNVSSYVNRSLWALKSQTSDEARLHQLDKDIFDTRQKLAILESEWKSVKARVEDKARIRLDINLETDCHAWYLKALVQSGIFRVMRRESIDPVPLVKQLLSEKKIHAYEIEETPQGMRLTDKASNRTLRMFSKHLGKDNALVPSEPETWVVPYESELTDKYFLRIDYKQFRQEFLTNQSISEAPTEFFKQFSPRILTESVKRETKQEMMPFYQNPPEITVDEAKKRVEGPYRGEN
jgi:hypothetical protein